jgi:hypothetical protein
MVKVAQMFCVFTQSLNDNERVLLVGAFHFSSFIYLLFYFTLLYLFKLL